MTAVSRDRAPGRRSSLALGGDAGITLIEVLVSALVVVLVAIGSFTAIQAATRSSTEERHRLQAHGLAEEDQARMRAMKISALSNLKQTRTVTVSETDAEYTIDSRGEFVANSDGDTSCDAGASADYIRITSRVSWPSMGDRPPVVVQSIVTPPNGSIAEDRGALAIMVMDAEGNGIPGVGLQGVGAGSFSGTTDENGCAMFGNLPEGNYTLTPSGIAGGLVDRDGNPPGQQTTSVVGQSTNQVTLQFAEPGEATIRFEMRTDGGQLVPASARSVMAFNTGMSAPKAFPTANGQPASAITAGPLFPFTSPITFYAGSCQGNNPNPNGTQNPPGAAAMTSLLVPAGGTAPQGSEDNTVQLPAVHVIVERTYFDSWRLVTERVQGARVTVRDATCGTNTILAEGTTDSQGRAYNLAVPWGKYDVCAQFNNSRRRVSGVDVQNLTATGTRLTLDVGLGAQSGSCP